MGPFDCAAATLPVCRLVLRNLSPDDLARPTPCTEYTVDGVGEHLVRSMMLLASVAGEQIDTPGDVTLGVVMPRADAPGASTLGADAPETGAPEAGTPRARIPRADSPGAGAPVAGAPGGGALTAGTPATGGLAASTLEARVGTAAEAALAAWQRRGLDGSVAVGRSTLPAALAVEIIPLELLVHSWDIAQATGQHIDVPGDVAGHVLDSARHLITPDKRGRSFAAEVPPRSDATILRRLIAFTGRTP